jgi:hypothetical protein
MEAIMSEMQDVRRNSDGSIDFDFYRARARTLRRAHIAQVGRASRRHAVALLRTLAERLWPDRHPTARPRPALHLAPVRQVARKFGK